MALLEAFVSVVLKNGANAAAPLLSMSCVYASVLTSLPAFVFVRQTWRDRERQ